MKADGGVRWAPPWQRRLVKGALCGGLALALAAPIGPLGAARPVVAAEMAADAAATVIARYQARIPELMAEQGVPGLAVALVDADQALWMEGFGHLDGPDSAPVTADTIFSIQSMSKLFTATAVMQAAAAGRLEVDAPITTYLPEFTVHSAFEEHPERKITLRMLLSHTAGFTHEAPLGNNNELDPGDFDAHVRSISDTWLRFPVGTGYAYSNLGIDLAGYILERVEGKAFPDVMRDSLLGPLGMDRSSFDRGAIRSAENRALGHASPFAAPPLYEPMTAAGGMYASADDLARFLRFQLNDGSLDGRVVLDARSMEEMRTVPAPHAGAPAGCALGVVRHRWNRWGQAPDLFNHGGGGFGFLSDLWWVPQLGIGVAVLTNSEDHQLQGDLALSILGDLVAEPGPYRDRLLALPTRPSAVDPSGSFDLPTDMADLIATAAMGPTGDDAVRWADHVGAYGAPKWGVIDPFSPAARFIVDGGVPYFEANEDGSLVRFHLVEVTPGVFLADNGETLDLASSVPTWRSVRLVRLTGGPALWQWAMLGAVAALATAWLFGAAMRVVRRRGLRSPSTEESVATRRWRRIAAAVATLTALVALGTVALIAAVPGLVDSGFLGWLDLPLVERLALHLPLALAALAAGSVVLAVSGSVGRWWSSAVKLQFAALAVAAVALVGQLAAWRLIGWGMG
jgi:CubicO group peptidase (beta-lactamase class C family)